MKSMLLPSDWAVGDTLIHPDGKSYVIVKINREPGEMELVVEGNSSTGARTTFRYTDKRPEFKRLGEEVAA